MVESFIFILILVLLAICAYSFHKIKRIHLMQYAMQQQLDAGMPERLLQTYRQVQAFIDLNRLLQLPWALPPLRGWAASPDFLLLLVEHARQYQPEVIVECSSGASTIVLAQCAQLNGKGHVWSLEHDAQYAEKTRQELIKQRLDKWATVIVAPLKHYEFENQDYQWYTLNDEVESKQIDMLVIDGPPAYLNRWARYPAGPLLLPLCNEKSTVLLDDADRVEEREIIKNWIQKFEVVQKIMPTACEKGACLLIFDN